MMFLIMAMLVAISSAFEPVAIGSLLRQRKNAMSLSAVRRPLPLLLRPESKFIPRSCRGSHPLQCAKGSDGISEVTTIPDPASVSATTTGEDTRAKSTTLAGGRAESLRTSNEGALSKEYPEEAWPRTWVPLASTYELEPDRPSPVEFLGYKYVVWRDNHDIWHVMDDACAHRLAPLSEARVDRDTNTLECAYHGWAFDGDGACMRIPQMREDLAARACKNTRASVKSYDTHVQNGVVFFWPWAEDRLLVMEDDKAQPEGMLKGVTGTPPTYTRDLPYGWDMLLENLADPAHIPFAHHGLQVSIANYKVLGTNY